MELAIIQQKIHEIRTTVEDHSDQLTKIYGAIETLLAGKENQKNWDERERIGFK